MLNQNAPRTSRAQGGYAFPKRHERILRERLGMVDQAPRPLRLLPGLVLLLSPAALVGGLSTPAVAQCVGQIASSTNGATVTNNGCIATTGYFEHGIESTGADAAINNTNSGTITTSGIFAYAISSTGDNATITNSGTITTSGPSGFGIYSTGADAAITNSGTITTSGPSRFGIYSTGADAAVTNSGTITTSGIGIVSIGADATITNSGTITTSTSQADGILSGGADAAVTNSGTITTSGSDAYGIHSYAAGATITNSGTVTTSGNAAYGIVSGGASAAITNSGTITTSGNDAYGINFSSASVAVTNSGTITTSGIRGLGIYFSGANAAVTNSGSIAAASDGIRVEGSGATISNLGTITAGAGSFGIRVAGAGSVATLTNAQGGNTPLTYSGSLPSTYNVVVRSASSFGRLAVTNPTGTMTFGVDATSTLSYARSISAANRYTDVLSGVSASAITNEETEFTLGRFAWMLTAGSATDSWDLLARLHSPDATNTLLGLQSNAHAVRSVLAQRAAATTFALDYDCSVFDAHGVCVSVGFRNSQIGSDYADTGEPAGLLTVAYRVTPEFRIGGFIDQNMVSQSPDGVDPKNTQPMFGAFAVYQENADFAGLTIRAALAYQEGDLRITRPELTDTEAGTGTARTTALAFGGEIAYGVALDGTWVAQPYAGMRRSDSQRRGYTETTSDSVEFPITYSRFGQQVTSATAGLRLRGAITPEFSLTFGAGMEHDLNSKVDRYAGTSTIPDLETFSINASQQQNETRAVGSAGMRYMIASNQALGFDVSVRQLPYGDDPSITTMWRYSIGF